MRRWGVVIIVGLLMAVPSLSHAGNSIGVYCWNMQPYSDVWCLDVEDHWGFAYEVVGTQHVSGSYKVPVHGSVSYDNYQGIYSMMLESRSPDGSIIATTNANLNTFTLSGPWQDDWGDSGTFVYVGAGPRTLEEGAGSGIGYFSKPR